MNKSAPDIEQLSRASYQILRSFTVNAFQSFEDNIGKKPPEDTIKWVRKTQKIINEYIREILRFNKEEMINGINNQIFIKIQDEIIMEQLKSIPMKDLTAQNLLYQKLIEAFSLHNQYLMNEWLFSD